MVIRFIIWEVVFYLVAGNAPNSAVVVLRNGVHGCLDWWDIISFVFIQTCMH